MTLPPIDTTMAALVAGAVTSAHCAAMCGPLACAALPKASVAYHAGRILSYGLIGMLCGAVGRAPLSWLGSAPAHILPWFLALAMLAVGFGFKPRLPRPAFLMRFYARMKLLSPMRPVWQRGLALGLLTPLLPCGPLYFMFGASMLTGSMWKGMEFSVAFALGTVPLLWIAQGSWRLLGTRLSPRVLARSQRVVALLAAVALIWRLSASAVSEEPGCGCCAGGPVAAAADNGNTPGMANPEGGIVLTNL